MIRGGKSTRLIAAAAISILAGAAPAGAVAAAAESDNAPVVLRGSRPAAEPPAQHHSACPAGSTEQPGYGCAQSGIADETEDPGYWPYLGFGDSRPPRHQDHRMHFAHRAARPLRGAAHIGAASRR